ncbi:MAG: hypothetical protein IPL77_07410 [Flavobacteriales bacterium]|nr:hypothetical protein [Flavobacteriales bacterium]
MGRSGEEVVLAYERQQLTATGRTDLAEAVEHISRTEGDGTGWRHPLLHARGSEEVHRSEDHQLRQDHLLPDHDNEVAFSATQPEHYHLYRLFEFGSGPKLYTLRGPIEQTCWMVAKRFEAG